jgi:hypothetical protein
MAKVWSTLTDGYSNEQQLTIPFINGVGWARDGVHMVQLESWYGYHVDRTTDEQPDVLDKATKEETAVLCAQYSVDMTGKPKWTIIAELREAITTMVPVETAFKYSYGLNRWLEANVIKG